MNQQLVLDNEALFMPNGTWIVGEMAQAPRADGFEWGMTALPALEEGSDGLQLHLPGAGLDPLRR